MVKVNWWRGPALPGRLGSNPVAGAGTARTGKIQQLLTIILYPDDLNFAQ
jgi:hypothetical protein